jgi:molybdate transport system substrate-binding protein
VRRAQPLALVASAVVAAAALAACGKNAHATAQGNATITVLAAASLQEAFLAAPHPHVRFSFAGSSQLVAQVQAGAPADVIATADTVTMQRLVTAHLVDAPRVFARNRLAIVTRPGNPKGIRALADLSRADVHVVLADPAVPAGRYAREALARAHVTAHPVSLELDVKAVVQKVASGEADAGIVYTTDVRAAGRTVAGVAIPDADNVLASYPIAVVRATSHRRAATAFVDDVLHGSVGRALRTAGFLAPGP